ELDAVLLLKELLVLVAQVHHRLHVHLVEGGEHGGSVLRILEAAGDGLAQARHLHALFANRIIGRARSARGCGLCSRGRSGSGGSRGLGQGGKHVFLEHLTGLARTGDGAGIKTLFIDQLLGRGGRSTIGGGGSLRCGSRCSESSSRRFGLGGGLGRNGSTSTGSNGAEQRADVDRVTRLGGDRFEHAG